MSYSEVFKGYIRTNISTETRKLISSDIVKMIRYDKSAIDIDIANPAYYAKLSANALVSMSNDFARKINEGTVIERHLRQLIDLTVHCYTIAACKYDISRNAVICLHSAGNIIARHPDKQTKWRDLYIQARDIASIVDHDYYTLLDRTILRDAV